MDGQTAPSGTAAPPAGSRCPGLPSAASPETLQQFLPQTAPLFMWFALGTAKGASHKQIKSDLRSPSKRSAKAPQTLAACMLKRQLSESPAEKIQTLHLLHIISEEVAA